MDPILSQFETLHTLTISPYASVFIIRVPQNIVGGSPKHRGINTFNLTFTDPSS